jgi:hypothetical protein
MLLHHDSHLMKMFFRIRSIFVTGTLWLLIAGGATAEASKRIVVDLTHQIAIAYQDGQVLFYGLISTGKEGRRTPTGSFHVREKDIDHISNLWPQPNGGAKMHYMLRITRDGIAMHLGPTPDYPASHGCIRMKDGFAQRMYAWAEKWTSVDIIGTPPAHSPAVALPAYAKSSKLLRRSIGGGTRGPMAAMSGNPKDRLAPAPLTLSSVPSSEAPLPVTVKKKRRSPLAVFSSNPKRRNALKKPTKKRHKRPSRHFNPLKAISAR